MFKISEQDAQTMAPIQAKIINFFKTSPKPPSDEEVHKLADELGIDPHEFEAHIYMLLWLKSRKVLGKHKHLDDSEFDENELAMGMKVELEHTDCPRLAKEIAKDHLVECKTYYTRLAKLEEECKKAESE